MYPKETSPVLEPSPSVTRTRPAVSAAPVCEDRPYRLAARPGDAQQAYPKFSIFEESTAYFVEALAAGLDPAHISISIDGRNLRLRGVRKPIRGVIEGEKLHFERVVRLPWNVDTTAFQVEYYDPVLLIRFTKPEYRYLETAISIFN
ncbi:MAG: Hsp20 family protein [bacterium]|nr:Hsp20 family protein [bacterium]